MTSSIHNNMKSFLPESYQPDATDILIGRGHRVETHAGNVWFRSLVASHLDMYSAAGNKSQKTRILLQVFQMAKSHSKIGAFVKQDRATKRWFTIEDGSARITVAQAFRDALSFEYRSSKQFKQKHRHQKQVRKQVQGQVSGGRQPSPVVMAPTAAAPQVGSCQAMFQTNKTQDSSNMSAFQAMGSLNQQHLMSFGSACTTTTTGSAFSAPADRPSSLARLRNPTVLSRLVSAQQCDTAPSASHSYGFQDEEEQQTPSNGGMSRLRHILESAADMMDDVDEDDFDDLDLQEASSSLDATFASLYQAFGTSALCVNEDPFEPTPIASTPSAFMTDDKLDLCNMMLFGEGVPMMSLKSARTA